MSRPYERRPPPNDSWPADAVQHTLLISGPGQGTAERRVMFVTGSKVGTPCVPFVWVGEGAACYGAVSDRKALRAWATALLAELDRTARPRRMREAARRG